jgi:hypothetical protein
MIHSLAQFALTPLPKSWPNALAMLALVLVACVGGPTRGVALYAGPTREASTVATLVGDIEAVDGRQVSNAGRTFELSPGCHVVTTQARVARGWSVPGIPPQLTFVIQFKPGHDYVLEYSGRSGSATMNALEKDARGHVLSSLVPTTDKALMERCRVQTGKGD